MHFMCMFVDRQVQAWEMFITIMFYVHVYIMQIVSPENGNHSYKLINISCRLDYVVLTTFILPYDNKVLANRISSVSLSRRVRITKRTGVRINVSLSGHTVSIKSDSLSGRNNSQKCPDNGAPLYYYFRDSHQKFRFISTITCFGGLSYVGWTESNFVTRKSDLRSLDVSSVDDEGRDGHGVDFVLRVVLSENNF